MWWPRSWGTCSFICSRAADGDDPGGAGDECPRLAVPWATSAAGAFRRRSRARASIRPMGRCVEPRMTRIAGLFVPRGQSAYEACPNQSPRAGDFLS